MRRKQNEHIIHSNEELVKMSKRATDSFNALYVSIKSAEAHLAEIAALNIHILNNRKTKNIYADYRKSRL